MNPNYQHKIDENEKQYIAINYSYKDSNIEIRIYEDCIKAVGIDEQVIFIFLKNLNFLNFKLSKNSTVLKFKCNRYNDFNLIIKHINNKVFFKLYVNEKLSKKAFCYINKENKPLFKNSAQIILKHLLIHKEADDYDFEKISNQTICAKDKSNNNYFLISIFDNDIIKIESHLEKDKKEDRFLYTDKSLHHISYLNSLDFLLGTINVPEEEINKIKLSKKMNEF